MRPLLRVSQAIDAVVAFVGHWIYWLILAAVLVSAGNAIVRKAFDVSSNAYLELQWYLFGAVFMLASAYTLQRNEHIRIDILSSIMPARLRGWIDVVGHLFFLLPFAGLMTWQLTPWVIRGIESGEMSANAGGIILWPARMVILVGFILLFFQGVSELIKRIAVMRGLIADPHALQGGPHVPIE